MDAAAFGIPDVRMFTFEVGTNCRCWGGLWSVVEQFPHLDAIGIPESRRYEFSDCRIDNETYPN